MPGFPLVHTHTGLSGSHANTLLPVYSFGDRVTPISPPLPQLETINKVPYLPLVPALFCQVTSLVSFLLSASLSLSLFPCFSPTLTLPSLSLSPAKPALPAFLSWLFFPPSGSRWFFLPDCMAQGQRDIMVTVSGRLWALSCAHIVLQFVIIWFCPGRT